MTDQKQEKPKQPNWIVKAGGDAVIAGGAFGAASLVVTFAFDWPIIAAPQVALVGFTYSLWTSWQHSKEKDKPKGKSKSKGRTIPFNHGRGSTTIDMEYSLQNGGVMLRESYIQALKRKIRGEPRVRPIRQFENVSKPKELDEFVFFSQGLQLRQYHVDLFLKSAWKNRQYGRGLSARRWVRGYSQRELWFQELSPMWFFAMLDLLRNASDYCQFHLVVEYENGWRSLLSEPHLTMRILRWYEVERRKR